MRRLLGQVVRCYHSMLIARASVSLIHSLFSRCCAVLHSITLVLERRVPWRERPRVLCGIVRRHVAFVADLFTVFEDERGKRYADEPAVGSSAL